MTQKLYLGIDGGGTKTNAVLASIMVSNNDIDDINILSQYKSGPSSFQLIEQFYTSMDEILDNLIKDIIEKYNNQNKTNTIELSICAGYAGVVGVKDSIAIIEKYFREKLKSFNKFIELKEVKIISDAELVLNTYFGLNKPGIILISGTGSICLAKNRQNEIFRSGGFGHLIDDMGSGYYFGKSAIKLALNSHYNYNEKSPLEEMIKKHYKLVEEKNNIDDILNIVHTDKGKTSVASSSPLLFEAANSGCKFAKREIQLGIEGLSNYITNCYKLIQEEEKCTVILHGSVFKAQQIIKDELTKNHHKNLNFKIADKDPEIGAIMMLIP